MMKDHIVSMVMDRVSRYGSRDVFRFKNVDTNIYRSISWDDFALDMSKVSRALISLGFGPADNIGIFSDNCPEWVVSDLGIQGIRGVVIPFYATSSKQQLKYIADETNMKLIFVGNGEQYEKALWLLENSESVRTIVTFNPDLAANNKNAIDWSDFINLDSQNQHIDEYNQLMQDAQPEDLATIIYTSGTTGESKGVMLTHASLIYAFKIHDERLEVSDADVSACFLPLSHVFERTWTYYILHCGATNVFIENPREIVKQLPFIKPTLMCTVPRFFEKTYEGILLEISKWPTIKRNIFSWSISIGQKRSEYLSRSLKPPFGFNIKYNVANKLVLKKLRNVFGGNIRFMPCAGAAISPHLLRFFHAAGIFVTYGYGATETSATVSCFKSDRYDFTTCGTIMPGVEVKISDEGEILIKSNTVFKGYFKKTEDTNKTLVDGWYCSGDQGYITEKGDLVMTDRIKDLIKTSVGKYVSPQKIELIFSQDPFIEQIIPIGDNRKFVTALIVPSFEMLKKESARMGMETMDNTEIILQKKVIDFYQSRVDKIQEDFTSHEKIVRFKLLPEPFSIQNGALTNTLKVRRSKLIEQYKELIDQMYDSEMDKNINCFPPK